MGEPPQVMLSKLTYTYKLYLPFYTTGDTYLYLYLYTFMQQATVYTCIVMWKIGNIRNLQSWQLSSLMIIM